MADLPIVAITGADGFVGSHLTETVLRTANKRVRALVWYNSFGHHGWLDQVLANLDKSGKERLEIVVGDVRDSAAMRQFVVGAESVIHLAALIAIPYSYQAAESYVETNIRGTLNLLEASRSSSVGRFVQVSTSEVYGSAQQIPMSELHPLVAQSPYAATKIAADQLALSFWLAHKLPVTVVRPFNIFGPRQSVRAIVPTIIVQALAGDTIQLGRTDVSRDLTFVADTVRGLIAASELTSELNGQCINLGTGREIEIPELVEAVGKILGRKLIIATDETRMRPATSEVNRLVADASRASQLLYWNATTSLHDGLLLTVDWFNVAANRERFHPDTYRL